MEARSLEEARARLHHLQALLNTTSTQPTCPGRSHVNIRVSPHWFLLSQTTSARNECLNGAQRPRVGKGDSPLLVPVLPWQEDSSLEVCLHGRGGHPIRQSCLCTQLSIPKMLLLSRGWGQARRSQEVLHQPRWAPTAGGRSLHWAGCGMDAFSGQIK